MARLGLGRRTLAAWAGASVLLGTTAVAADASARTVAHANKEGSAAVRVGARPQAPAGARTVGELAGTKSLHITIALKPRDPAALQSYATAVATPGSSVFRHYLSVAEFRSRFAPTDAQIASVRSALISEGVKPSPASANGLEINITGNAAQLSRAFSVSFDNVRLAGGRVAYANTAAPAVPAAIAPLVQGVLGLDSLQQARSNAMHRRSIPGGSLAAAPDVLTGGPQPCSAATGSGAETADELASSYDFSPLYQAGDEGAGQTIALAEFEPDESSDISAYASCYGLSTAGISYIPVDGGVGSGYGEGESTLDIEDVLGLAPDASILVYQDPGYNDATWLNLYNTMVSQDRASVISTSWYENCNDAGTSSATVQAENTILEEAATQGQSFFAATGDSGSEACLQNGGNNGALNVQDMGSQPFVTGVGGTLITDLGPRPTETTWNDGPGNGGGGGGISKVWPMPAYQSDAPAGLNVINANSSGAPCAAAAGGYCREDPDVSADSASGSPYAIEYGGGWYGFWGTSAAAPLWAAYTALVNGSSACSGTTVGFANPLLYTIAADDDANAFNDVTTGNNDVSNGNGGLFPAGTGYDMATGLGTPNGAVLGQDLCAARAGAVTVTNPGDQSNGVGDSVSLPIQASDATGATLSYSATGLPSGLSIDPSTGVISGNTTTGGGYLVTVKATDADHATGSVSFSWTVGPVIGSAKSRTHVTCQHPTATQIRQVAKGNSITLNCTALVQHAKRPPRETKPSGTVSFSVTPAGTSQPASCALPGSTGVHNTCKTYLTTSTAGSYTVIATYSGDPSYAGSSAETTLKIK
jgi:subtilase family serine protease